MSTETTEIPIKDFADIDAECVKCANIGVQLTDPKYVAAGYEAPGRGIHYSVEHLRWTCPHCGLTTLTRCADFEEPAGEATDPKEMP